MSAQCGGTVGKETQDSGEERGGLSLVSAKEERDLQALLDRFAFEVVDIEQFQQRLQDELAALEVRPPALTPDLYFAPTEALEDMRSSTNDAQCSHSVSWGFRADTSTLNKGHPALRRQAMLHADARSCHTCQRQVSDLNLSSRETWRAYRNAHSMAGTISTSSHAAPLKLCGACGVSGRPCGVSGDLIAGGQRARNPGERAPCGARPGQPGRCPGTAGRRQREPGHF